MMQTGTDTAEATPSTPDDQPKWYVLRDLKRPNAKERAYAMLQKTGFEVFTPLIEQIVTRQDKRVREQVPYIPDLVFCYSPKHLLSPIITKTKTLQFRFVKGGKYQEAMTVDERTMNQFMNAVKNVPQCKYYNADELSQLPAGTKIRIVGGVFDGYEGELLSTKGSSKKRILLKVEGLFAAAFEVGEEYIEVVKESE